MPDRTVTLAQAVEVIIRHLGYREDVASAVVKAARRQKALPASPPPFLTEAALGFPGANGISRDMVEE